jgi:energy-coupling factor transport system substrate-specific component
MGTINTSTHQRQNGLSIKDLVTTGIFTALLWIAVFIPSIPFGINPLTTFYMPIGAALLAGPIFLLMVAKVPKRGPIAITGILIGVIFFFMGMHWAMDLGYIVCGILGDFIAGAGKYKSVKMNIFAYALLCLGATGTYIVYFIDPAGWTATMVSNGTSSSYIDTMNATASPIVLIIMFAGTIMVALLSGWAGKKLLKKQFEKAGITT